MEESLIEELQLLKSALENTPLPIGVYAGIELKIILANEAMVRTLGKGHKIIGKLYTELLPELESQELFGQALSVMRTGVPFHAKESRVDIAMDGVMETHYFDYSFIPLRDAHGAVYAIMNTGSDVTDLVKARHSVEQAEEQLRLAISAGGLGTYVTDISTSEVVTSETFDEIWGTNGPLTRADIISKIDPEDLPIRVQAHEEAKTSGNINYEVRLKRGRRVRVSGKIISNEDGNPATIVGVVQDITETRKFSDELKRQVESRTGELQRSNEDLLHFANLVSHDLKEPVRKISFFNALLNEKLEKYTDEESRQYFGKVQHATKRMKSIIDGVLNYSTLSESGQPVQKINLDEIIAAIKTDLELIIQEKKAILVQDNLPEIEGVTILLHQLFYNLIHNALKFSRPDEPPRVIISAKTISIDGTGYVRISIKDNGLGFDPTYSKKIFNAFERLHSKDEFEGTGLGLALCKRIAERHNGTIDAIGSRDDGAEFIIQLPVESKARMI